MQHESLRHKPTVRGYAPRDAMGSGSLRDGGKFDWQRATAVSSGLA